MTQPSDTVKIHYDPRDIWPHWSPATNEWVCPNGVHTSTFRRAYVTVDGYYAGAMSFSTERNDGAVYALCYGERDQILGVPRDIGEAAAADFIVSYYSRERY